MSFFDLIKGQVHIFQFLTINVLDLYHKNDYVDYNAFQNRILDF